jgi:hypothetical protein
MPPGRLAGRCCTTAWGLHPAGCKLSPVNVYFGLFFHGHGFGAAPEVFEKSQHRMGVGFGSKWGNYAVLSGDNVLFDLASNAPFLSSF